MSCKPHAQGKYLKLQEEDWARGINGPIFSRTLCGGANASGSLFKWDELPSWQRDRLVQSTTPVPWQVLAEEEDISSSWPHHPAGLNKTLPPPDPSPLYDEHGNIFKSSFTRKLKEEHLRMKKEMVLLSMTTSIGKPPGFHRPNPLDFTRKSRRTLPQPSRFYYPEQLNCTTKPRVPKVASLPGESPPRRNFPLDNAAEVIVEGSRIESKEDRKIRRLLKEDFSSLLRGEDLGSPNRLKRLRRISRLSKKEENKQEELEQRKTKKQEVETDHMLSASIVFPARTAKTAPVPHSLTFLPEESRLQLIDKLKDEWETHNKMLQRYSLSLNYLDSISRVRKREAAEHNMKLIEEKIKLLSHEVLHCSPLACSRS